MEKWNIGDIAICVKTGDIGGDPDHNNPPLRKNSEYIVGKIHTCECGEQSFDVGLSTSIGKGTYCSCGAMMSPKTGIWWCSAKRFVKKQTKEEQAVEELLKTALEGKDELINTTNTSL